MTGVKYSYSGILVEIKHYPDGRIRLTVKGTINNITRFNTMCDFYFIPPVEESHTRATCMDIERELEEGRAFPFFAPPPLFTPRHNVQMEYPSPSPRSNTEQEGDQTG
eukprot:GHVO01067622.1.p1 GENE.GHVO01067622.1~~GHVO01067622.1.p1  ORF type:complete len:123 (+),score=25.94 GHVO01067622.1:47-370(+)